MRVTSKPRYVGKVFTADMEVGGSKGTHTYSLRTNSCPNIVAHNTVSLLAGASPGGHFPNSRFYIRRVRIMRDSPLLPALKEAGYKIEPCIGSEKTTVVVEFPISFDKDVPTCNEVSIWEKLELASFIQENWSDNQVSVTVDFDAKTEGSQIAPALNYFQYKMKSVSFLPRLGEDSPYPQMPYEAITEEKFNELNKNIKPLKFNITKQNKEEEYEKDIYCDGDKCMIIKRPKKLS
jgi:hypothetical protein